MTWSITANGIDLTTTVGFALNETDGVHGATERALLEAPVYGRTGGLVVAATEASRKISLTGVLTSTAKTVAARAAAEDQLRDLLRGSLIRLTRSDGSTTARTITGYCRALAMAPIGHPLAATDDRVTITLDCPDAYWTETEVTSRLLGATRATLPLGTAPSTPIIRIMGSATNPVLTYRDAGGTSQKSMTFTVTLAATNDWLDIDMRTAKINKYATGAITDGITLKGSGDPFPWAFDPQDGDYGTSAWPTLEVSAGTGVAYWWKAFQ